MGSSKAIPKGEESQNVSVLLPAEPIRPSEASEGASRIRGHRAPCRTDKRCGEDQAVALHT